MTAQILKVKTENPSLSHAEALKTVGRKWKLLSSEEKQAFEP
jgi:hypothetical protein